MEYFLTFELSFICQESADLSVKLPNLIKTKSETFSCYMRTIRLISLCIQLWSKTHHWFLLDVFDPGWYVHLIAFSLFFLFHYLITDTARLKTSYSLVLIVWLAYQGVLNKREYFLSLTELTIIKSYNAYACFTCNLTAEQVYLRYGKK